MRNFNYLFLILIIWCSLLITCSRGHSHNDHHNQEPPSFKYSREANEKVQHVHHHGAKVHKESENVPDKDNVWLYAMSSTLLISAAPLVILFVVPLDNSEAKQPLLKILLAFASGGLLGDAFLHLIPHASMKVDSEHLEHDHNHQLHNHDMSVGLGVLSGILAFLLVEKSVRFLKNGHGHGHGHSHTEIHKVNDSTKNTEVKGESGDKPVKEIDTVEHSEIKVAGYLNLAADFSHNFTDGLAIGASYLAGNSVGVITTITILLHEVPHEIGDFAILLQSGVSRKNAMLLQLTTAIGALIGTALSLCAQDDYGLLAANWILPFTAGGFIYIALVSVIPELLAEEKPNVKQTILQIGAMLGGVYMMIRITEFE